MKIKEKRTLENGNVLEIFDNGTTVEHALEVDLPKVEPEPTEKEIYQAEVLLNQTEIISKQAEQDEVLAEILLNGLEV